MCRDHQLRKSPSDAMARQEPPFSDVVRPYYWVNGSQWGDFGPFCSNGQEGVYYNNFNYEGYFYSGYELCNTWGRIAGKPCETIES
jgi:hypothetical protein